MKKKINFFGRSFLLLALAIAVVLGASTNASAFVSMSPDQVTCTPCHTDGRLGDGKGGEVPHEIPQDTSTPAPAPVESVNFEAKGQLTFAPKVNWDDLWSWIEVQQPEQIPTKYDELF